MRLIVFSLALLLSVLCTTASAEPFLAIENGLQCRQCHVNPTGGGMRNAFGSVFSQTQLPARTGTLDTDVLGQIGDRVGLGVDVRASGRFRDDPVRDDATDFGTDRITAYVSAQLGESMTLYVDQQFAPGGSLNREAWARFSWDNYYVKAGQFFQPFGWRIEDDSAFIRTVTNINFNTPDEGVEVGYLGSRLNAQLTVTNGTGGAPEIDDGKQATLRIAWIEPAYRLGVSTSHNNTDGTDRTMYGVFTGFRTGPVSWLLEFDRVEDEPVNGPDREQDLGYLSLYWQIRQGHYLNLAAESISSDLPGDRERYTLEYQWFPLPFTQLRLGFRDVEADDDFVGVSEEIFLQLHIYF